jgi:hypothetical protein
MRRKKAAQQEPQKGLLTGLDPKDKVQTVLRGRMKRKKEA